MLDRITDWIARLPSLLKWSVAGLFIVSSFVWTPFVLVYTAIRYGRNAAVALCIGWRLLSVMSVPQELWRFHDGSRDPTGLWLP